MAVIPWPLKHAQRRMPAAATTSDDTAAMAAALIQSRQTILPKRLAAPGPRGGELAQILGAAAHAPDHGKLTPWRFVLVSDAARPALADVFARALRERDPAATPEQAEQAREKAYRAPVLMLVVVDGQCGDPAIDLSERLVSAGCAVQNMLLMATAQGYGSALTSGKALKSAGLRGLFQLAAWEQALCFISIGTVQSRKAVRARPVADSYVSTLDAQQGVVPGF
ncbi:nitroreductase [Acidovorax sp. ACV01]|uniref:nitroreductase family protein n=1 Tax=Acidovorax sp. ACV01 TaxID=2769311 RepID=UPI00177BB129|nr:nitroreductase [Acidovorax sp. ACV01]MBD9394725.1 nitroreductase [Acidovorax sp. ACV01]